MHAIVLAGQPNHGMLRALHSNAYEAEIPVGGRAMADWILDALSATPSVTSIGLVGPSSLAREGIILAPVKDSLFANILQGLLTAPDEQSPVLFVTSDIPWITSSIVEEFIQLAPPEVDVVYPIIPRSVAESRFPGTKRTYVRLKEGVYTGGNLFVARPTAIPRLKERAEVLLAHRKSPILLARDVGVGLLVRLLLGKLSIPQAENKVGGILGIQGRALVFPHAEAGVDVDKPEDLALAERELGRQSTQVNGQGWELV